MKCTKCYVNCIFNEFLYYFNLAPVTSLDAETTISCSDLKTPLTELVWRFNHSQTILKRTGSEVKYTEEWRPQVKRLSDSGSLTLQDLSLKHEGTYTCELSNAEETCITNTFLRLGALKGEIKLR